MRLIDGDALEREISVLHSMTDDYGIQTGYVICMRSIENAPTIEPRKKGKWIEYDNSHCECPFCHEEWSYFDNEVECFNYCPNCGADMREEGETDAETEI